MVALPGRKAPSCRPKRAAATFPLFITWPVDGVRFAANDQCEDAVAAAQLLEGAYFLIDPSGTGGRW
jgi:hypothetical protein